MTDFALVEMAQWQGSGTRTARRLVEGAARLAELASSPCRTRVLTSDAPGRARAGVAHADVLARNLAAAREAVADAGRDGRPVITVGGDCGIDIAPVEAALRRYGDRLAVVWFDAHGDLNTPASSPSGAFHGMVLRTLLGEGPAALCPEVPLDAGRLVLAGVRALDPAERDHVRAQDIALVGPAALATPDALIAAVAATGADTVHIHIDLDVLDPAAFTSVGTPEPDGVHPDHLVAAVRALAARFAPAGLTVTEYEAGEASPAGDRALLRRLVPDLVAALYADAP